MMPTTLRLHILTADSLLAMRATRKKSSTRGWFESLAVAYLAFEGRLPNPPLQRTELRPAAERHQRWPAEEPN